MILREDVIKCVENALSDDKRLFLVDVTVSRDNVIEVDIESSTDSVTLDDCVALSRKIEEQFDREKDDFELTVASAGLDMPFKVMRQYTKAVGSQVEVMLKGGKKIIGTLYGASEKGILVRYEALEAVEGKKRKVRVEHEDMLAFDEVNSVKYHIIFK